MGKLRQQRGQSSRKVTEPGFKPKHFDWAFMPLNTWWPCLEVTNWEESSPLTCQSCSAAGRGWGIYCSLPNCSPPSPSSPCLFPCLAPAQVSTGGDQAVKQLVVYLKGKRNTYQGGLRKLLIQEGREKINEETLLQCLGVCFVFIFGLDSH